MLNEQLSLFFTNYFFAILILSPLYLLYFLANVRKVSLPVVLTLHKLLVVAGIGLPVSMFLYSLVDLSGGLEAAVYPADGPTFLSTIDENTPSLTAAGRLNTAPLPSISTEQYYYPVVQSFVFYFSDVIAFFSGLGLTIFALRWSLQRFWMNKIERMGEVSVIETGIVLIRSAEVNSPFSVGLWNRKIFIPSDLEEDNEKIILRHELNHFACRHHCWSFAESALAHLFWFNPIATLLRKKGGLYREMECDDRTIQSVDKFDYSRLLIESAESILTKRRLANAALGVDAQRWVDQGILKNRIDYILGAKGSYKRKGFYGVLGLSSGLAVSMFYMIGNINDEFLESEIRESIVRDYAETLRTRETVTLKKVPPVLLKALIVHEDGNYYSHNGLSVTATLRAIGSNLKSALSGGPMIVSGGSTITQQLAKSFLKEERSFKRKFKELKVASVLEKHYSKDLMLEMYLNRVYFGNGAWGLNTASETYFNRPYTQLSAAEAAMLIPFLKAPTQYNLIANPELAQRRQSRLLKRMAEEEVQI